jgi:hypothetical protein
VDSHVPFGCISHSNGAIFQENLHLALSSLYLGSIGGIFLKIHSLHKMRMHNKWYGLDVIDKKILHFT